LLGYPDLDDLDPVYCMPSTVIERRGLRKAWAALPRRAAAAAAAAEAAEAAEKA